MGSHFVQSWYFVFFPRRRKELSIKRAGLSQAVSRGAGLSNWPKIRIIGEKAILTN